MSETVTNNITRLLTALLAPVQEIEDAFQQLYTERRIDTAVGTQLDVLGIIVGQPRSGMSDDDFRRMIRARISVNKSKGTIADVLTVAGLVINSETATLLIENQGAAALVLRIPDEPLAHDLADLVIPMLRDTVAAGVRIILEYSPEAVADWLEFDIDNLDDELMIGAID